MVREMKCERKLGNRHFVVQFYRAHRKSPFMMCFSIGGNENSAEIGAIEERPKEPTSRRRRRSSTTVCVCTVYYLMSGAGHSRTIRWFFLVLIVLDLLPEC